MKSYFCVMKVLAKILLVIFISFLSTPTVVALVEKHSDISMFYSFAEEEIHKDISEFKADFKQVYDFPFLTHIIKQDSKIFSNNLSRHDNIAEEIFSPPPELV